MFINAPITFWVHVALPSSSPSLNAKYYFNERRNLNTIYCKEQSMRLSQCQSESGIILDSIAHVSKMQGIPFDKVIRTDRPTRKTTGVCYYSGMITALRVPGSIRLQSDSPSLTSSKDILSRETNILHTYNGPDILKDASAARPSERRHYSVRVMATTATWPDMLIGA